MKKSFLFSLSLPPLLHGVIQQILFPNQHRKDRSNTASSEPDMNTQQQFSQPNPGSWSCTGVPHCWHMDRAPPWLLLTKAPGCSNSPSQASNCARFFQQVIKDGSSILRVNHLSYSSEGITLVKTWRRANLKSASSLLLKPAVPALMLLLWGESHICQLWMLMVLQDWMLLVRI